MPDATQEDFNRLMGTNFQAQSNRSSDQVLSQLQPEGQYGGALHINVPALAPTAAPPEAPAEPSAPQKVVRPPRGLEDLPLITRVQEQVESGGRDKLVDTHQARGGPAYGPRQIQEGTARDLGLKGDAWKEGDPNRDAGDQEMTRLWQKYGNWEAVLRAYNGGPAAYDSWVKAGKPDTEWARKTGKYAHTIMSGSGVYAGGLDMAGRRGTATQVDFNELMKDFKHPAETAAEPSAVPGASLVGLPFTETIEEEKRAVEADPMSGLGAGVGLGLVDMVRGPAQAALEQISPEKAAQFTAWANGLDEHLAPITSQHPYAAFAGRVIGSTLGILSGAKLIAPLGARMPELLQQALRSTPAQWLTGVAGGAAAGATNYNPSEEEGARGWETAVGAVAGTLGVGLARGAAWTMRNVADQASQSAFLQQLKDTVGILGPNVSDVRDAAVEHVTALEGKLASMRAVRDTTGRQVGGFPAGALDQAAQAAVDVGRDPEVAAIAGNVRKILGITQETARRVAWEREQARFDKAMEAWNKKVSTTKGMHPGMSPAAKVQVAQALGLTPPTAPAPFVPGSVTTADFARGMGYLEEQAGRASGAKRSSIVALQRALEGEAGVRGMSASGAKVGPTAEYFRAQRAVREMDKDVRAISEHFGVRDLGAMSPAAFYDSVTKVVERGDAQEIRGLRKLLGGSPRLQAAMANDVLHKMLMDAGPNVGKGKFDASKIGSYIEKHRSGLQTLFSREQFAELEGQAKIAERIAALPKAMQHGGRIFGWSGFLGIIGLEHAFRGHVVEGATLAASGFLAHSLYNFLSHVHSSPQMRPVLRRAAQLKPGSKELDAAIGQVMTRMQAQYTAAGRVLGQQTFGGEAELP